MLKDILNFRRAVRYYAPTPISEEKVRECLKLATLAPTGFNMQLYDFYHITDKALLEKYKQQNRGYKNDKTQKSCETLINKGIEAKKPQNRDKTKCTKGYIYMQKMSRNNAPNCTRIGRIYLLHR